MTNAWAELAMKEGHRKGLPESPRGPRKPKGKTVLDRIYACLKNHPKGTTADVIHAETGIPAPSINVTLSSHLSKQGKVIRVGKSGARTIYKAVEG